MDIYTGLAFGVILMLCVGVLALISLFGMKTKTYDEARAEKRTVVETVKIPLHSSKQKKNKKVVKKTREIKEDVKNESKDIDKEAIPSEEVSEEFNKEHEPKANIHVEFQEPEIIPVEEVIISSKKNQKRKGPVRPILVNKDEPKTSGPPSTSSSTTSLNHFENIQPKDDLEKFRSQLAVDSQKSKLANKLTKSKLETVVPKEVKVTKAQLSEPIEASAAPILQQKSNKKKKSEISVLQQLSNDKEGGVGVNVLAPILTRAQLSRSELQLLIDLLLNKQHGPIPEHTEWYEGRSDPVQKLKKQLLEKEKALTEEQETSHGVQAKLRELRAELNAERSRIAANTRTFEQTLASKTSEMQQLASKLQVVVESHNTEKRSLAQQLQQYQAKLAEEHNAARKLQEEQNAAQELLAQRQQYENHIGQLKENEALLNQQLHQMHAKLLEMKQLQEQLAFRDQQMQDILQQLEESRHQIADYDQRLAVAQIDENELKMEIHRLQTELRSTKDDISGFANMESEMNRLSMLNNKVEEKHLELIRKHEEADKYVGQLKMQVASLQNEKESLVKQITELSELQNGSGNHENSNSKVEILNLQNALDSKNGQLKRLEVENNDLKNKVSSFSGTHDILIGQLEELKLKNDELRTKNWNVMEALLYKEKLIADKSKELQNANSTPAEQSKDSVLLAAVELIQRIIPEDVSISKNVDGNPEEYLNQYCQKMLHLHEQNSQLAATVAKYKRIILDTEGVLNDLQSRAETEETLWKEKFAAKEAELQAFCKQAISQQSQENNSTNGPTKS